MKSSNVTILSPIDGSVVATRPLATDSEVKQALELAHTMQKQWARTPIDERALLCSKAINLLVSKTDELALEITKQMGRPIKYSPGEINGLAGRARYMIKIAEKELADIQIEKTPEFNRFIQKSPIGVVFTMAPWNYPFLTAVNSIIPALMAGNAVLLRHSAQTLLCGERFEEAFLAAGLPKGVFKQLNINHEQAAKIIQSKEVAFSSFTGSVTGGTAVEKASAGYFKGLALELGGKDAAYVTADVNLEHAVKNLVDGAFFNSGQSCCGIERIYVHESVYEDFIEAYISQTKEYQLGNPLEETTTLGPMINVKAAAFVREQIKAAKVAGAKACIDESVFNMSKPSTTYLAPQVLVNVNHSMDVMRKESFGPVVGIMKVTDDSEAIKLINDSPYGLTASVWTKDENQALEVGALLEVGTVFMNRCDYLDPALAWVGVKHSGKGCSLSKLGYNQLTRPKSFHLRYV